MTLLNVARTDAPNAPYVRGDMRTLPFHEGAFGLVVNLFTSFGYFSTDAQHQGVLTEVGRVTRRGGMFVLDYLNATEVRRTLVPQDERVVEGRRITQRRAISADGRYVEKQIIADGCDQAYEERVRLFSGDELRAMIVQSGFTIRDVYGDYDGSAHTNASPRIIMFAERR
jgi:SAM-dependent methyltransferase